MEERATGTEDSNWIVTLMVSQRFVPEGGRVKGLHAELIAHLNTDQTLLPISAASGAFISAPFPFAHYNSIPHLVLLVRVYGEVVVMEYNLRPRRNKSENYYAVLAGALP